MTDAVPPVPPLPSPLVPPLAPGRPTGTARAEGLRVWGLVALLAIAGTGHFAAPQPFEALIPDVLGNPRAWVLASGGAELACAVAIAVPRTRRIGALAAGALFIAVFPGNVVMALDSLPAARTGASAGVVGAVIAWGRLPLQIPLVLWALGIARRAR